MKKLTNKQPPQTVKVLGACACSLRQQKVERQESEFEVNLVCKKTDRKKDEKEEEEGEKEEKEQRRGRRRGQGRGEGWKGGRPENLKEDSF